MSLLSNRRQELPPRWRRATAPISWSRQAVATPYVGQELTPSLALFDTLWCAGALLAILFLFTLGASAGVLVILCVIPAYCLVRYKNVPDLLATIFPLLILPAFALASAAWSVNPGRTSYYGIQYLITVLIGGFIGAGVGRKQALVGIFLAFLIHGLSSYVFGSFTDWGGGGASRVTQAFSGLFGSKNTAANAAATGLLVAAAGLVYAIRVRSVPLLLSGAALLAINAWSLRAAESTGAIVACAVGGLAIVAMSIGRPLRSPTRMALLISLFAVVVLLAASESLWLEPMKSALLQASGKDASLTGRTFIWDQAKTVIAQHPGLGRGYGTFWYDDNLVARRIVAFMGVSHAVGFNFHNTYIEITVHLGYVGLAIYGIVAATLLWLLVFRTTRAPDDLGVLFCAYMGYVVARSPVESQFMTPFSFGTVLIAASLAYGLRRSSGLEQPAARPEAAAGGHRGSLFRV